MCDRPRIPDALIRHLAQRIGRDHVLTDPAGMTPWLTEPRGRYHTAPLAVVRPASTGEVSEVVRLCRRAGIAIVTRGGGTGTVGGASMTGQRPELLLSTDRMRSIERIDRDGASLTAGAGVALERLREAAAAHGLDVPLRLASGGSATLGGVLATNAGGHTTIRHGNARRMALGLEAVLADGRVLNLLSGLRKDNAGYDLINLLVGSEGTLGIITRATIALVPRDRQRVVALLAVDSPGQAVELLKQARRALGETLTAFELIPRIALDAVLGWLEDARDPFAPERWPWHVLMEAGTAIDGKWLEAATIDWLERAQAQGLIGQAVVARSGREADRLWQLREAISPAQRVLGASIKHDIAVPVDAIPELIQSAVGELQRTVPGIRPCIFGHVGDGNLHFNLSRPEDWSDEAFRAQEPRINRIVFDRVQALGGSIAAEHGIGQLRVDEVKNRLDPVRLDLMRSIKRALDPDGVLNPGKRLPPDGSGGHRKSA
ncbi:MAG: FAD-binding oxidoreductase [Wenzhouxiangellaceae bacterium]